MIISIGYRVKSYRGVQFRIWATQILKEYLVKGFVMNDELLKRAGWWKFILMSYYHAYVIFVPQKRYSIVKFLKFML